MQQKVIFWYFLKILINFSFRYFNYKGLSSTVNTVKVFTSLKSLRNLKNEFREPSRHFITEELSSNPKINLTASNQFELNKYMSSVYKLTSLILLQKKYACAYGERPTHLWCKAFCFKCAASRVCRLLFVV